MSRLHFFKKTCLRLGAVVLVLLAMNQTASAQIKLGDNPGVLNPNAILEMESTTKGLLMPRMTATQMNAIAAPSEGLMVYNTTDNCVFVYKASTSAWLSMCENYWTLNGTQLYNNAGTTVGIGTNTPAYKLDVSAAADPLRLTGVQAGVAGDEIVTINATGVIRKRGLSDVIGDGLDANNGITLTKGNPNLFQLGGPLIKNTNIAQATFNMTFTGVGKFGIGAATPTTKLHILPDGTDDPLRLEGLNSGAVTDSFLTVDAATGVVRKRSTNDNFWNLLGNSGTNPSTNFLGTRDNVDMVIRTNNTEKVRVLANGNVGIGTATPNSTLQVAGSVSFPIRLTSASTTAAATDYTIIANCSGGSVTITLPAAGTVAGRMYVLKKSDESINTMVFSTPVRLTAAVSVTSYNFPTTITIQSDGTDYWVLNRF